MENSVFVVTKAELMQPELYVGVRSTFKKAEQLIRQSYPNARKDQPMGSRGNMTSFYCKSNGHESLMFIHQEPLE